MKLRALSMLSQPSITELYLLPQNCFSRYALKITATELSRMLGKNSWSHSMSLLNQKYILKFENLLGGAGIGM
jgi:hypothetical protein